MIPDLIITSCHNRSRFRDNSILDRERLEAHLMFLGHDLLLDEECMRVETVLDLNTLNCITCLLLMKVAPASTVSTRRTVRTIDCGVATRLGLAREWRRCRRRFAVMGLLLVGVRE